MDTLENHMNEDGQEYVRIGVIGLGNIGSVHAMSIYDGEISGLKLVAVCDINDERLSWAGDIMPDLLYYRDYKEMINSGEIQAVVIAVPHYIHSEVAICAFCEKLHVMCEKPAGVYVAQVDEMNEEAKRAGTTYSIMHNQRTSPIFRKMRDMVCEGTLGQPIRFNWLITNWYRTQSYYNSSNWRATWNGEGGGVLLNQAYHNIDLWQWIYGMPSKVTGFCGYGKYHDIEVEDEATIYAEYENGATAVFITTTGEHPGTNRLEISGTKGKLTAENGKLTYWNNINIEGSDGEMTCVCEDITPIEVETAHRGILQNFANAILFDEPLISPGVEGVNALNIINGVYYSAWNSVSIELPVDSRMYASELFEKKKRVTELSSIQSTLKSQNNQNSSNDQDASSHPNSQSDMKYSERWKINW